MQAGKVEKQNHSRYRLQHVLLSQRRHDCHASTVNQIKDSESNRRRVRPAAANYAFGCPCCANDSAEPALPNRCPRGAAEGDWGKGKFRRSRRPTRTPSSTPPFRRRLRNEERPGWDVAFFGLYVCSAWGRIIRCKMTGWVLPPARWKLLIDPIDSICFFAPPHYWRGADDWAFR